MAETYTLQDFIEDLDRITRAEASQEQIVSAAKPLLAKLVQNPNCIEVKYRKRGARPTAATCFTARRYLTSRRWSGDRGITPRRTITTPGDSSA